MIVRVAGALGRPVLEIANAPFALTLWSYLHVEQLSHADRVERQLDRFDTAGLFAGAMHNPKILSELHEQYLARVASPRTIKSTFDRARAEHLVRAHASLVKIDP